ncbi:response regulator [Sulfurimonas aquatica]|uniref:histidine kinase n=1 Tax=Sulfurimonas aquatica TaxID=2672570 RepID=A0A975AYP9_9BACT|nr:ATP-binding protein [Sulfurimonas aquatica]QSZ41042.1 response regulator [Sulfurimonas aquatica]
MKYISLFILFTLFSTILNASYIRSIRIGSFPTQKHAEDSLAKINEFVLNNNTLVDLQAENYFEFKTRRSGKYYITLVEPFTQRPVLQKVLDILRTEYEGIYVSKLKSLPEDMQELEEFSEPVTPVVPNYKTQKIEKKPIEIKENVDDSEDEEYIHTDEKEDEVLSQNSTSTTVDKVEKYNEIDKPQGDNSLLFQILSFALFIILLLIVRVLVKQKKDLESYVNQDMINVEKFNQVNQEISKKDKIMAHVSHELRSPVTAIMGLTHLVLETGLTKVQKDYITKIESSSEHLLNLLNDILDVSKIEAGELKIEKSEFNINDILNYVISVNTIGAQKNNTNISLDIAHDVPSRVIGDSLRLGQVLINLLGNSVKFTHDGEIALEVKKISEYSENLRLEFSISDTGIGMSDEELNKVFTSYFQADDSTSREFGGTGLGLSISKQLIEMMHGEIKVQSKKGIGTTFTFNIQFKLKDSQNQRQYRLPSSKMLNKKVLIVDPSNKNVIPIIKSLGYFNYRTTSISSFEEAVLEKDVHFDIVIINQERLTKVAIEKIQTMQNIDKGMKVVTLNGLSGINNNINNLVQDLKVDAYLNMPCTQNSILNLMIDLYVVKKLDQRSRKIESNDKFKKLVGKKMLVAEDNELNHKVISGLLAKTGIEIIFVRNGQEAVDLIRKDIDFDIVLMDINMPLLNGYEATREIRKSIKYNSLPILALTADVMDESITKAYESGMQGHIAKPIIVDIFYKKIIDTLSHPAVVRKEINQSTNALKKELGELEELSVMIGLGRCNNDVDFYKSILNDFKSMYANSSDKLKSLCEDDNFKQARRMAMDIKDVALNIGAYNLCESAATMEYEFEKGSRSNWKDFIEFYSGVLEKLLKDIDTYLTKS